MPKARGERASAEQGQISRLWRVKGDALTVDDRMSGDENGVYSVYSPSRCRWASPERKVETAGTALQKVQNGIDASNRFSENDLCSITMESETSSRICTILQELRCPLARATRIDG